MQKILQFILPFELPKDLPDDSLHEPYAKWDQPSRQIQISAITFLTAMLYVVFTFLDKSWAPVHVQVLMLKIHYLFVLPMLLSISFLAYKQRYYQYVMPALALFPVISLIFHAYIASKLENFLVFVPEAYLGIFWIFVVSGMTFRYALVSASCSTIIVLVSAFYYIKPWDIYVMYIFWVFCSFSFGFLGALIFDRTRKHIFMNQQELQRLAVTDSLTGLYNRNQLNMVLTQEIERGLRYDNSFGLLVIDVDHFKNINDSYGHDVGDETLKKIAHVLTQSVRENDTLIRWGGEEFIIIAIRIDEKSLIALGEKLRGNIAAETYSVAGKVTASVGAAIFKVNDSQKSLLARADKALYKAKNSGRNTAVYLP